MASEAKAILSEMPHLLPSLAGEAGARLAHSMPFSWHFLGPIAFLFGVTLSGTDMTADSGRNAPRSISSAVVALALGPQRPES